MLNRIFTMSTFSTIRKISPLLAASLAMVTLLRAIESPNTIESNAGIHVVDWNIDTDGDSKSNYTLKYATDLATRERLDSRTMLGQLPSGGRFSIMAQADAGQNSSNFPQQLALVPTTDHPVSVLSTDGLFATFSISQGGSPLGGFTAKLNYERAPLAVANFVSLAEGTRTWIDPVTFGPRSAPFYNGTTFHRVVPGFIIQGGSPQADGSDGPGYTFPDEFDPALRHDAGGILSMANSGTNSNGSQFFVTLAATPWLDDAHSIFGTIVDGLDVVQTIGTTSVDGNNRPRTDVVIDSVTITRNGTAAQNFDASAQALPIAESAAVALVPSGTGFDALYTQQADRQYFSSTSTDLANWTLLQTSPFIRAPDISEPGSISDVFDTTAHPKAFLRQVAVRYPETIVSPPDAVGKELVLNVSDGTILRYTITHPAGPNFGIYGSAQLDSNSPGDLIYYFWTQEAHRVRFAAQPSNFVTILVDLVFETETSGTFDGLADPGAANEFPTEGTFTFSDIS